ncbi:MAG: glutamine--fructose-6-phosphate transaminase (isomerizing), partial [Spirochaetales bacterium]|nr:glutamine--fructose-6-phosphate transaminase (isomerizing) [Spirochaetales bacterium]
MCGIVGYCGPKKAADVLLEGLKRLEYRGYDSAGICINNDGALKTVKRKGKIKDLREIVPSNLEGHTGIGHTRWATHGEVTDENAHPHSDDRDEIVLVHNGIIENYQIIKNRLIEEGHTFKSDTDSEVISHLVASLYTGNLETAVRETVFLLKGTYGLAVMHKDIPNKIVGVRNGSPLVVGVGDAEMFLASDVTAIMAHTKQVIYLEDKELVVITPDSYKTFDFNEKELQKKVENIGWDLEQIEKDGYDYYMEKEIYEQPESILRAFVGRIDRDGATGHLGGLNMTPSELINIKRIQIVAAGTSYYAGMVGAYLIESIARIPASTELASEVRYKNPVVQPDTLYFVVSQSGETADTL